MINNGSMIPFDEWRGKSKHELYSIEELEILPKGTEIEISDDKKDWSARTFVVCHNGVIYCENSIYNKLTSWKYARPVQEVE